jgi:hypothetical protein
LHFVQISLMFPHMSHIRPRLSHTVLLHFLDYVLYTSRRELRCGDQSIEVEPQVLDLLTYLIENNDRVITHRTHRIPRQVGLSHAPEVERGSQISWPDVQSNTIVIPASSIDLDHPDTRMAIEQCEGIFKSTGRPKRDREDLHTRHTRAAHRTALQDRFPPPAGCARNQ